MGYEYQLDFEHTNQEQADRILRAISGFGAAQQAVEAVDRASS